MLQNNSLLAGQQSLLVLHTLPQNGECACIHVHPSIQHTDPQHQRPHKGVAHLLWQMQLALVTCRAMCGAGAGAGKCRLQQAGRFSKAGRWPDFKLPSSCKALLLSGLEQLMPLSSDTKHLASRRFDHCVNQAVLLGFLCIEVLVSVEVMLDLHSECVASSLLYITTSLLELEWYGGHTISPVLWTCQLLVPAPC